MLLYFIEHQNHLIIILGFPGNACCDFLSSLSFSSRISILNFNSASIYCFALHNVLYSSSSLWSMFMMPDFNVFCIIFITSSPCFLNSSLIIMFLIIIPGFLVLLYSVLNAIHKSYFQLSATNNFIDFGVIFTRSMTAVVSLSTVSISCSSISSCLFILSSSYNGHDAFAIKSFFQIVSQISSQINGVNGESMMSCDSMKWLNSFLFGLLFILLRYHLNAL